MDTMKAASRLTLLVLIMAVITRPVLSDSCNREGLREGRGAFVADKNTFGCRNTYCDHGSPDYHIILHGNNQGQSWDKVKIDLKRACDRYRDRYGNTILFLMSGYPVTWVLTGFTSSVGHVFLVGDGAVLQDSGEIEFTQSKIDVEFRYHRSLRKKRGLPSYDIVKEVIITQQEDDDVSYSGWSFKHQVAASVNYAWMATSWTLTLGEDCCASTTKLVSDTTRLEASTSQTEVSGSASRQGVAGVAAGIGAILVVVILTIVITIVCWCCCRKGKWASKRTTSQTNQLNTVQGLQTIESGATQEAEPNVYTQSHPTPFNYPTGGPQPSTGLVRHPEPPPPYNNVHPIQPPRYSQVIREHNGRVEPTAPPLHI